MSIKKRLERLEGTLGPRSKMHLVRFTRWPPEEQEAYDRASEEEKKAMIRAHVPDLQEGDVVVLRSGPRPRDPQSNP
ncbi:MAG: hypothetical protein WBB22_07550 [Anaerolineae bacterium]